MKGLLDSLRAFVSSCIAPPLERGDVDRLALEIGRREMARGAQTHG